MRVTTRPEIRRAEDVARSFAASIGFAAPNCEEIVLVVAELGSNLVTHAGGGTLTLTANAASGQVGIQIESEDQGPGIADFDRALTDGYSSAGSLGAGLGAVNRLMDELELRPLPTRGTHIVCRRWLRAGAAGPPVRWLEFGAATRACRNQRDNGDAFIVRRWNGNALTGVIDGLGHGQFAQKAAQTARRYVDEHFDRPLEDLFRGAGRACRATRGVVMALARFDFALQTLTVASIGNIEVRLFGGAAPNLIVRRGIVGLHAPQPVTSVCPWTGASLLVMHSDGVRSHWDWKDVRDLTLESASTTAQRLLAALGKIEDDATVLVVRSARS
jgi:anti-sigma regulatory factor (Ser/Thr protein kinase)